jgi:hypothetical protein
VELLIAKETLTAEEFEPLRSNAMREKEKEPTKDGSWLNRRAWTKSGVR